jgi:hypothetical protein
LLTCESRRNSRETGYEERVHPAVSPYGEVHWTPVPPVTLLQVSWKTSWGVTFYLEDAVRHLRVGDGPVESTARMSPVDSSRPDGDGRAYREDVASGKAGPVPERSTRRLVRSAKGKRCAQCRNSSPASRPSSSTTLVETGTSDESSLRRNDNLQRHMRRAVDIAPGKRCHMGATILRGIASASLPLSVDG